MNIVNQKIIDAVIEKAEKVCPDSLALIGIYGSVATGEEYEKSDLDLLILIQNDNGWQLGTGFILGDSNIGYDIYCTNWDGLKYDAECHHAKLSKLLDSKIVYIKNQDAYDKLCKLREQAKAFLESEERLQRSNELVDKAKVFYANAHLHESLGQVRMDAYGVIYYLLDAVMIFHGAYFKRGVKRTFEEIYSNWRNKVEEAAKNHHIFASYMNMCSLQFMFSELSSEFEIGEYDIMEEYNPDCLEENVRMYDKYLEKYEAAYKKAGIEVNRFSDVDAFVAVYLGK